ncbi:MAG TPA: hypothetical protein VF765_11130 [Polyangiaceae bacterium]
MAVLDLPKRINVLITYADNVVTRMTGNAYFPSPAPALAAVSAAITDLQNAETAALARTKGAAATRNAKRAALVSMLQQLRTYVQTVAETNEENAPAIIQSAGIAVKKTATRKPRVFAALAGAVSGTVKIVAPSAGRRVSYAWQYSTDGKTWIDLALTLQAKATLAGQTPGTVLQFRYRWVTKTGETDWSAPVTFTAK